MGFSYFHKRRKHADGSGDNKNEKPESSCEEKNHNCKSDEDACTEFGIIKFLEDLMGIVSYRDRRKVGKYSS